MDDRARPYRSVLYIPGSKARALEKAKTLPVDAIIFDLEDAVAPDEKANARKLLMKRCRRGAMAPATSWSGSTGSTRPTMSPRPRPNSMRTRLAE